MANPQTNLISLAEAAKLLGFSVKTLRRYCNLSRNGKLVLNGNPVTIQFFQTGERGQGRILLEANEISRLKEAIAIKSPSVTQTAKPSRFKHIRNTPGHPD